MKKATVTVTEAAEEIGVHKETVYRMVANGVLPRLPGTRKVLIPRVALDAYLEGVAA